MNYGGVPIMGCDYDLVRKTKRKNSLIIGVRFNAITVHIGSMPAFTDQEAP